jgi:hypothetical protein
MRDVYIKPSAEFKLNANQALKLLRPLYGLADSGDYWGSTLLNHLKEMLGMKQTVGDPAMFFKMLDNKLQGVCATYMDDALHTGSKVYEGITEKTMKRFKCAVIRKSITSLLLASKLARAPTPFNFINSGTFPHSMH